MSTSSITSNTYGNAQNATKRRFYLTSTTDNVSNTLCYRGTRSRVIKLGVWFSRRLKLCATNHLNKWFLFESNSNNFVYTFVFAPLLRAFKKGFRFGYRVSYQGWDSTCNSTFVGEKKRFTTRDTESTVRALCFCLSLPQTLEEVHKTRAQKSNRTRIRSRIPFYGCLLFVPAKACGQGWGRGGCTII